MAAAMVFSTSMESMPASTSSPRATKKPASRIDSAPASTTPRTNSTSKCRRKLGTGCGAGSDLEGDSRDSVEMPRPLWNSDHPVKCLGTGFGHLKDASTVDQSELRHRHRLPLEEIGRKLSLNARAGGSGHFDGQRIAIV